MDTSHDNTTDSQDSQVAIDHDNGQSNQCRKQQQQQQLNGSCANTANNMASPEEPDLIMMSPLKKELHHTVLRVERVMDKDRLDQTTATRHVAGGQHQGIIVNKQLAQQPQQATGASTANDRNPQPDLRLAFKVFLINAITQIHQQELRELRFWFQDCNNVDVDDRDNDDVHVHHRDHLQCAQSFFRELVNPRDFPKNYVGFIMKLMKTMQQARYRPLLQIELEVKQTDEPFERPTSSSGRLSIDLTNGNQYDQQPPVALTEAKVLEVIESAYPNPLSIADIAIATCSDETNVRQLVEELCSKGVARLTDMDQVVRVTSDETQVKRVKQMPNVVRSQQPTVAIITAQFCEKLAVDAMIDNKDTYVRYKGEGESNVYTLGNIGHHRVVATKLPAVGNSRSAMIAAGNTTTRLLGTFQHVEYVFLVGIGGGVPHYTDHRQHVRLGDVVVSTSPRRNFQPSHSSNNDQRNGHGHNGAIPPPTRGDYIYVHCEKLRSSPDEPMNSSNSSWKELQTVDSFNYRFWCPLSMELQDLAQQIYAEAMDNNGHKELPPWEVYLDEARNKLQQSDDLEFVRPSSRTDKLYMSIGPNDMIEMAHPESPQQQQQQQQTSQHPEGDGDTDDGGANDDPRERGMPKIHFGAVGSGRMAVANEQLRQDIAFKFGIKAFDIEFDTVIESIFGNRKDRYIIIRGIADYKDGSRKKEWQPYAALSAAAYMKAILCRLPSSYH